MNRPFHAFGALLMLLALAMIAVNSSPRQATLDRPPAAPKKGVLSKATRMGGAYLVVLPAPDTEELGEVVNQETSCPTEAASPWVDARTSYDASYDEAVYGDVAASAAPATAAPSTAEASSSVRSGRWLLRFAASSLNQVGSACEKLASQLESLDSETIAAKANLPTR